jgi:type I restriction enzyme M protein
MNLLLHGLEYPKIDPLNSLRFPLREIGDSERVDVIMTNPPFGGEEERGILGNFPSDKQTSETALLFLQLIMRKLKRRFAETDGGRCGVIVPNGILFGDGVAARIKEQLLEEFNLHTIVRLPKGVFAPYTDIDVNLLFFEHVGPTKEIWYYQVPLPKDRKVYTKTKPMTFEEFQPVIVWWHDRKETQQSWRVHAVDIIENNYNLDIANPKVKKMEDDREPEEIVLSIIRSEEEIFQVLQDIHAELRKSN